MMGMMGMMAPMPQPVGADCAGTPCLAADELHLEVGLRRFRKSWNTARSGGHPKAAANAEDEKVEACRSDVKSIAPARDFQSQPALAVVMTYVATLAMSSSERRPPKAGIAFFP